MKTKKLITFRSMAIALCAVVMMGMFPTNALAWKFIVYGDTRTNFNDHKAALQSIKNNTPDYKFIINVGDVVDRGHKDEEWDEWKRALIEVFGHDGQTGTQRYYSCPGNHDKLENTNTTVRQKARTNWKTYLHGQAADFPENDSRYFSFDYNNARFIILNNLAEIDAQKQMIIDLAQSNPHPWLFAVWHFPIFPFGEKSYQEELNKKFGKVLYENGCDIIFVGHAHNYVRTMKIAIDGERYPVEDQLNGTAQVLSGDGGAPRDNVQPNDKGYEYMIRGNYTTPARRTGYTELEINGEVMTLKHIMEDNSILDQATYTPNEKPNCTNCGTNYTLEALASGPGSVSLSPAGGTYEAGTNVTLTATPDAGCDFVGWSGDASGTANTITINMNSDKSVTATFNNPTVPSYTLTTHAVNGSVSPQNGSYDEGTPVLLTATADPGYAFANWSGDASGTANPKTITMDSDKDVTANFTVVTGPETVSVTASDDAYVRNGSYSGNNYGSSGELQIKQTTNSNAKRFTYLKFDLRNIGNVSSAVLKVKNIGNYGSSKKVNVIEVADDNWSEGSITWGNKPSFGSTIDPMLLDATNAVISLDVTDYVAAQANGDNYASFMLKGSGSSTLFTLDSKEGGYAPRLIIEHDGALHSAESIVEGTTSTLLVYPNPTGGLVNIEVSDADFTSGTVKIYNEKGALLETMSIESSNMTIELEGKTGLYLIEVSYNGISETMQVIKK